MWVLWLMEFQADPSNSHSGMVDGSLASAILFFFANTSSTKQWGEPESNRATNGQACSDTEVDVRERRDSERGKWNSAVLLVQHCPCLGNFSIVPCLKSCLLVF